MPMLRQTAQKAVYKCDHCEETIEIYERFDDTRRIALEEKGWQLFRTMTNDGEYGWKTECPKHHNNIDPYARPVFMISAPPYNGSEEERRYSIIEPSPKSRWSSINTDTVLATLIGILIVGWFLWVATLFLRSL